MLSRLAQMHAGQVLVIGLIFFSQLALSSALYMRGATGTLFVTALVLLAGSGGVLLLAALGRVLGLGKPREDRA